jgi:NADPH-dependent curcumin reductase CurA
LVEEGGFDAAIDYKADDIAAKIKEHAPQGVDVFFDNVGGDSLDAALMNLKAGSRAVICGGISTGYASWSAPAGPKNYMNLILHGASMKGFLVLHYMKDFGAAMAEIGQWVKDGKLKVKETVVEGLENAPSALQGLFTGKNLGKMIIKVADPV